MYIYTQHTAELCRHVISVSLHTDVSRGTKRSDKQTGSKIQPLIWMWESSKADKGLGSALVTVNCCYRNLFVPETRCKSADSHIFLTHQLILMNDLGTHQKFPLDFLP